MRWGTPRSREGPDDRRRLDEVGASADDVDEGLGHGRQYDGGAVAYPLAMPKLRAAVRRLLRGRAAFGDDAAGDRPRPKRRYLADALEGVARVRAAGNDRPMILATWPLDRENPFQTLLTGRAEEFGIVPIGMDRLADLDEPVGLPALVALRADGVEVVLHLHWLARVLRGVASEAEGRERVASFLAALDAFLGAGGRLVWTVHNVLPHETRFPALDLELRQAVVARADLVHVLSSGTVEAAAPSYEIPAAKVLHVPHPAYLGVYPDDVSDADARAVLGIAAEDIVFGVVGKLRPYKGLDDLLDAFEGLTASPPDARRRRLLIAGMPAADPAIDALLARARANPDVIVDARHIPAEELSVPTARQRRDRAPLSRVAELGRAVTRPVVRPARDRGGVAARERDRGVRCVDHVRPRGPRRAGERPSRRRSIADAGCPGSGAGYGPPLRPGRDQPAFRREPARPTRPRLDRLGRPRGPITSAWHTRATFTRRIPGRRTHETQMV